MCKCHISTPPIYLVTFSHITIPETKPVKTERMYTLSTTNSELNSLIPFLKNEINTAFSGLVSGSKISKPWLVGG